MHSSHRYRCWKKKFEREVLILSEDNEQSLKAVIFNVMNAVLLCQSLNQMQYSNLLTVGFMSPAFVIRL
jgi:hypothetical protein